MIKLMNKKGATALATALGLCAYSIAPSNSAVISKPITPSEARDIKGGLLITTAFAAAIVGILTVDAALIGHMMSTYRDLETKRQKNEGSYARNP